MRVLSIALCGALSLSAVAVEPVHHHHHQHMQNDHTAPPAAATAALDATRTPVTFPAALKEHTLANMRDHLRALAEIQGHLAAGEYEAAADVAEQRLGMSSLARHGAHEVGQYMPAGMQAAGLTMHRSASRFAVVAQDAAVDQTLAQPLAALHELTQACVACHSAYRLD